MAVTYEISRYIGGILGKMEHVARKRADAADAALWAQIYAMIKSNASLDRPVARRLRREYLECEVSPPAIGNYRIQRFEMREGDRLSDYVLFRVTRD